MVMFFLLVGSSDAAKLCEVCPDVSHSFLALAYCKHYRFCVDVCIIQNHDTFVRFVLEVDFSQLM